MKRWEAERGLPIHRLPGGARSRIFAVVSELEAWRDGVELDAAADAADEAVVSQPRPAASFRSWLRPRNPDDLCHQQRNHGRQCRLDQKVTQFTISAKPSCDQCKWRQPDRVYREEVCNSDSQRIRMRRSVDKKKQGPVQMIHCKLESEDDVILRTETYRRLRTKRSKPI